MTCITDGDGNFSVIVIKNKSKIGWMVIPTFTIAAAKNPANYQMLLSINCLFEGIGRININNNTYIYHVMGLRNFLNIRAHLFNYPLMTYNLFYFYFWSDVLSMMAKSEHLTILGL